MFYASAPALAQVNPGVLQSAAKTANISGTVKSAAGQPVAGASVLIIGQGAQLATTTDAHGGFTFNAVPFGTYLVSVNSPSLGQANRPNVVISGDVIMAIQYTAKSAGGLKTIAEVSTKGAGLNINTTPASIYSFSPRDLLFQGNASWATTLPAIPGVSLSGATFGGFGLSYIPGS
ncbi:MAG TPA: carboxypeptidase-like regulatory domain-containing protein, partial [Candidatus Baltobacteraceae bacterium]|nr:carboxypeptidase-like regulatory domain-containing protein [Candidatus Baltobacteraceae bacterium]